MNKIPNLETQDMEPDTFKHKTILHIRDNKNNIDWMLRHFQNFDTGGLFHKSNTRILLIGIHYAAIQMFYFVKC